MKAAELYDADFAEWARHNADLLRSGRFSEADIEHVAEEIGDIAKRERLVLRKRLVRLIQYLLKWQYQPERRGSRWQVTIVQQRQATQSLLKESPSLAHGLEDLIGEAYAWAVRLAAAETRRNTDAFPAQCPYTAEQLLDDEFLP